MKKIYQLIKFLKESKHTEELNHLLKIADQINHSLDPKPFEIRLPQEINVLEGISSDATESCQLVNFGIEKLQTPSAIRKMQEKTPFFPEEINLIHFDLMKLIKCIDINEKSYKEFKELLYSLSRRQVTTKFNDTKESFLKNFEKFPYIKEAFEAKIDNEKINYILIGTSDTTKNFIGSEVGAQRFHQNTLNYVLHDLGHATYDVTRGFKRATFKPFEIIHNYILEVLKEFNKYLDDDKKLEFEDLGKNSDSTKGSVASLVAFLRSQKMFFDIRYLVGTHQGKAKMFTDKSDYDQDVFAYIMMSPTDQVSDLFKDPMLPPKMNRVFDNRITGEEDKSNFIDFIKLEHKKMIDEIQKDLEEKMRDHGGYINFISEKRSEYRKDHNKEDKDPEPIKNNILIFNMLGEKLFYLDRLLAERLSKKKYSRIGSGIYVGDKSTKTTTWANSILTEKILDKNLKAGNLAIVGAYTEDNYEKILKRFKAFGNYRVLFEDGDEYFYVSDDALRSLSMERKDRHYEVLELTEEDRKKLENVQDKDKYTKKILIKKPELETIGTLVLKFVAVFFEDADLSRLKSIIQPLNPEEDPDKPRGIGRRGQR